jgi:hypothetical protein
MSKRKLSKSAKPKRLRKPKQAPLPANIQRLEAGLRAANAQLKEKSRDAAVTALHAVMDFIHSVPALIDQNLGTSIWALLAALEDLNHGRVVAMLAPAQVGSRKREASIRKVAKAYAIFAVDILRSAGSSVPEACRFVAKELKRAGIVLGGRQTTPDWKSIKSWRDRISRLPATDQERHTLEGLRKAVPRLRFGSLDSAKNFVSGQLRELLQKMGKPALE